MSAMPSLLEFQARFADALLAGGDDLSPGIAVYRNAVRSSYRKALGATFEAVKRLVGAAFFHGAVDAFARDCPSLSGDLNAFGDRFGEFLAGYGPARDLPYLPDVARLEWAVDEAGRAADVRGTREEVLCALATIRPEDLARQRLALAPACRLLESPYPVFRIWQVNQPGFAGDAGVSLEEPGDRLLVRREAGEVLVEKIAPGEYAFLQAIARGADFAGCLAAATAADPRFDLGVVLAARIADRTIAGFLPGH